MNCLQRWKEQKPNRIHRDNRGSSLALIMSIIAVIGILGAVLLSVSLVTFRMKDTYSVSQKNFYNAESVVDAIYIGLQQDVAAATGEAYSWTLQHYEEANEETREKEYEKKFEEKLLEKLESADGISCKLNHLKDLVPSDMQENINGKASCLISVGTSGSVELGSAAGGDPASLTYSIDKDTVQRSYTIRGLCVRLEEARNFMSEIQTDIVLTCPKIDFTLKGSGPMDSDLTSYVFVANEETKATGGVIDVNGNAYLGNDGTDFSNCTVKFMPTANLGRLVTAGQFHVHNNATIQVGNSANNKLYDFWAREIFAESANLIELNGTTYLNDDLMISNPMLQQEVKVDLNGRLYAYGNSFTAGDAEVFKGNEEQELLKDHPANYSSAILINGRNAYLDMDDLNDLIIAGNAYVDTGSSAGDLLMGESLSIRPGQKAYLVPAKYIAPDCKHGKMNPISAEDFGELQSEVAKALGKPAGEIKDIDYLITSSDTEGKVPDELSSYGVKGIQKEVHAVLKTDGTDNMIYFFLKFDLEKDAANFGNSYYDEGQRLSTMQARLDVKSYNTTIIYPNKAEEIKDFSFYYNGNVLLPSNGTGNTKFAPGRCTKTVPYSASFKTTTNHYQDTFAALTRTLMTDYSSFTKDSVKLAEIKENIIEGNLLKPKVDLYHNLVNASEVNGLSGTKEFTTDLAGTEVRAVVINNSCKLSELGAVDSLHLVIASGNVTVDRDFHGLIIAGGTVELMSGITVSADSNLAQQALRAKHADGTTPADYLNDSGKYLAGMGGTSSSGGVAYGLINYEDYVTYRNWKKQ